MQTTGLFPEENKGKARFIGNTAITGPIALISRKARGKGPLNYDKVCRAET